MLAAIAGMIGLAVVENQAANAITQNAGQASNQQQQQNVGQANLGAALQVGGGGSGGNGVDNDGGDGENDFKQSNKNSQKQSNKQSIKQRAACGGIVAGFSC
jgi:hypothetical protein